MNRKVNKKHPVHLSRVHKKGKAEKSFDKYELYRKSVQSAEGDVVFIQNVFKELKGKKPVSLREDFCGTFGLSCEWVKLNSRYQAFSVDLDPEPIEYGKSHYLGKLKPDQQKRIHLIEGNVLKPGLPKTDIAIAMNFSYFIFRTRSLMKEYFKNSFNSIKPDGIFLLDCFGGSQCYDEIEDLTKHKGFNYYWDQTGFDPVTNRAVFHIHFKPKGQKKIERVFSYDWRLWSIPELRDILEEVGFKKTHVYWEGTTKKGTGDGIFTRTEKGEACLSWIAYIVAEK